MSDYDKDKFLSKFGNLDHLNKLVNSTDKYIARTALISKLKRPDASEELINSSLELTNRPIIRITAIEHPNVTKEHITKALQDHNSDITDIAKVRLKDFK